MSAPGLQDVPTQRSEPVQPGTATAARISATASAGSAAAALTALAIAKVSATAEPPPQIGHFLDELAGIVSTPITIHQRELLTNALVEAIDARIAALFIA
ncbi:MAG: hypothetical protein ABI140_21165 [Jatrophihabitantaceae bacterium]